MSQCGFPSVLVNIPHSNKMRMCNDVRKLNDKTILQPYPMLNMNYLLAENGKRKCKYFSLIDLSDSYRGIPLPKRSQQIARMAKIIGNFSPTTCIFGLTNLLDDIIIYSTTCEVHVCHIEQVMIRLQNTTIQRMDERLDKLVDLLKSCQLSRTAYPAEQNGQPLQRSFGLICRTCGSNGHKESECFRSSYCNSSWVNQRFNHNSRNYTNDNFPN